MFAILLISLVSFTVASVGKEKYKVVSIQTSAICESCKARIEKTLKAVEGVSEALLNLNNKVVKVKYAPEKTNPTLLRNAISEAGYNADDLKRNDEAYSKLPKCCQVSAVCNEKH